ncbi:hypothetical protein [Roseitranquillus sediminis]|uniref:hypothetical protein n=1 Tax=Roseitranquillus sediminis TaxID=2809051 RepID=UPI001D0C02FE|nr:hypothetical protein [Roseitranquillus sediminis]MBM9594743.1 hypothetical protein [Roseitranquillus sediminis]
MRMIRWAVDDPLVSIAIVALAYLVAVVLSDLEWLHGFSLAADGQASVRDFWTFNIGLLAVHAALIGVVFPLVIAFVGLLNQGRATFSSRLTIYVDSSRALFVGMSSLFLCLALLAQLLFAERIGDAGATATLLSLAWFSVNALALAYFVLKTIAFLHPARRAPIMRAYVANEVWPREMTAVVAASR